MQEWKEPFEISISQPFGPNRPSDLDLQSVNEKWTYKGIEINLKKAGLEEHSPRKAVEFLMNQMKQYAKRYISMCPAQLRRKKHSEVKSVSFDVNYIIWPYNLS